MATAPDINDHDGEKGLIDLMQEITCPLCLDTFREPKLLSCDHVYCKSPCLEALLMRSRNSTISCPECRVVTQVTAKDVNNLRTAFHINRLKEVVARMKKYPLQTQTMPDDEATSTGGGADRLAVKMLCKLHPSQSLDIFCSTCTCQRLICRDCVVVDRTHENHDYDLVEKVAAGYKKALLESLDPIQVMQGEVAEALIQVRKTREQVASHGDALECRITHSFEEMAALLQQKKDILVARIRDLEKADLQQLNDQGKNLCIASDELASLMTSAQSVSKSSDQEFCSQRQELLSRITGLSSRLKTDVSLTPNITFPDIGVRIVNPADKVDDMCEEFSIVCDPVDPSKCYAEGVQNVASINEPSSFKVYLLDSNGSPCAIQQDVQVELKSLRLGSVLPAQVTAVSPSCYHVIIVPQVHTRGRCRLDITVNTISIVNSPFTVYIKCHPDLLGAVNKTIPSPFSLRCFGLNFSPEGNLMVVCRQLPNITHSGFTLQTAPQGGGVLEYHPAQPKFQVIRTLNSLHPLAWWYPVAVVTDSAGNVYVADQSKGQVLKYAKDSSLPTKLSRPVKVLPTAEVSLNGLGISKDGNIFICHSNKHRIEVLDSELTQMSHVGKKGSKPGQFNIPHDLSFDSQGNIYVTDSKNFRVQVLTQEGEFIRTFGTKGDEPGEFLCPNWIHVDGEYIYVTDYRSRYVSVFSVSGEFIHRFGADVLGHPEGIVVDEDGFVYVADSDKCMVYIF